MINFDGKELIEEFNRVFGNLMICKQRENGLIFNKDYFSLNKLTAEQIWWLVKFAKHVRGRCRNNSAFNNYMNRNFNAKFKEVPKEYQGRKYLGLSIEVNGQTLEENEGD